MAKSISARRLRQSIKLQPSRSASASVRQLFALIDEVGINYTWVAAKAGVDRSHMNHIKSGRNSPNVSIMEALGHVIGHHLEWVKNDQT